MYKIIILIILATISNMFSTFEISTNPLTHNAYGDLYDAHEIWYKKYGDKYKDLMIEHIGTTEHVAGYVRNEHILRVNYYRSLHDVPALKMHQELNHLAQILANHIVLTHYFEHGPTVRKYGENICLRKNWLGAGDRAADRYYDELFKLDENGKVYNFNGTEEEISGKDQVSLRGHAICMLWKNAKEIGVGVAYGDWFFDDTDNGVWEKNYVITTIINPNTTILTKFKENLLPRIKPFERLEHIALPSEEEPDNVLD
ncbi:Golgi-associated plant pathogenesis-related protein 1-like [Daktulosphaira vitifoliae]|uniref:Golgi-associated plant pathogenesis-related protein 1-like n=1 Tax=Daktulosphaira vitifoliae TaxID=58002 RepID=UPI0021AAEBFE|nr:Golgi-associated plant pathogenesis-related protein 1-like [Daktulosphaira vitifoliae]